MKKSPWKTYVFWIGLSLVTGTISGLLSRNAMDMYSETLIKPPLSPPGIVFPIVWTLLYTLMGISMARVRLAPKNEKQHPATVLFLLQLGLNFFWSLIFFNLSAYGLALIWLVTLWITVAIMIPVFFDVDAPAARLQVPYLLWLTFAAYLNFGVWQLNP